MLGAICQCRRVPLEAPEVSSQARNFRQGLDGFEGLVHLALAHFMGDHNNLGAGVARIELHDRLDRDVALAETTAHVADDARGILCLETHIVALANVAGVDQAAGSPAAGRQQGCLLYTSDAADE